MEKYWVHNISTVYNTYNALYFIALDCRFQIAIDVALYISRIFLPHNR